MVILKALREAIPDMYYKPRWLPIFQYFANKETFNPNLKFTNQFAFISDFKWFLMFKSYICFVSALPAFYRAPVTDVDNAAASISVSWDNWSQNIDYGTRPFFGFVFHYGKGSLTNTKRTYQTTEIVTNLERGHNYVFAVAIVGIDEKPGILSPVVEARVECSGKI